MKVVHRSLSLGEFIMQQPPNQYPSYPQQQQWTPQQGMSPQQQWQQQPYPPQYQPPMPPPPKRSRKRLWVGIAVAFCLLVIISGVAQAFNRPSLTSTDTSTNQQPTTVPTQPQQAAQPTRAAQPTHATQPTTAPTHPIVNAGPAILGANIAAFIAKYGQPIPGSQPGSGDYRFALYGNQRNDLDVVTGDGKAFSILNNSPTDQGWNKSEAIAACLAFLPPDSVYKREMTLIDPQGNLTDVQRVYYSPSLASRFQASVFTDENGNQTTPGTFAMVLGYNLNSTSSFLSCAPQVGLQGK